MNVSEVDEQTSHPATIPTGWFSKDKSSTVRLTPASKNRFAAALVTTATFSLK